MIKDTGKGSHGEKDGRVSFEKYTEYSAMGLQAFLSTPEAFERPGFLAHEHEKLQELLSQE